MNDYKILETTGRQLPFTVWHQTRISRHVFKFCATRQEAERWIVVGCKHTGVAVG